jgi:hypothetical protein
VRPIVSRVTPSPDAEPALLVDRSVRRTLGAGVVAAVVVVLGLAPPWKTAEEEDLDSAGNEPV